jgi:hypothetical protein
VPTAGCVACSSCAAERSITFTRLWTHTHETRGQLAEIPGYDARTHTIWVAGVVGVDVLDAFPVRWSSTSR